MTQQNNNNIVLLEKFNVLLEILVKQIHADDAFQPDTILALSTGGFPVAAALAKRLGIKSRNVVGIPVYKDETGDYHLDDQLVSLGDCSNRQVLVIDEASKRGLLTGKAVDVVQDHGGIAKSCVLISWKEGIQPDFVAETCTGEPPDFYWEQ
jgi:hypoxanthine phosphoribosyltransferase